MLRSSMNSSTQATSQSGLIWAGCVLRIATTLAAPSVAVEGVDLAIDVGFGDVVEIDQGQPAHAAARQGFGRPGADTADADHRDMGAPGACQRAGAIQALDAAEAALGIGGQ
jgi:hypothetical protein